jgi:Na+-transporting NADH:ubiquinone oxidoreductase subunit NqrF
VLFSILLNLVFVVLLSKSKLLEEHSSKIQSKKEKNCIIHSAYLDSYSQIEIANYLGLLKSFISKVIKSGDSTTGV